MKQLLILTFFLTVNISNAEVIDPLFSKQWAIKNTGQILYVQDSDLSRKKVEGIPNFDINFVDTSNLPSDKNELIVAVLDSGLDLNHPDLVGRVWYNKTLCNNAPNAKLLPCNGWNFLDNNNNLIDDVGHGTHVAGIIAANKNNIGIRGAADPRIKIMPIKVLSNSVSGFVYNGKLITDVIADAIIFAIKNGAEVINLSLGWPKLIDTPKVRAAFQMAEEKNVIIIAAAGNNNKDLPTFPCSYETVICVAAHDNRGLLTDFTNHGAKVDVMAPGEYIVSTLPLNLESRVLRIKNYEVKNGSSQAAPFVTASVANLKLLRPGLNNNQVRSYLFQSVKKLNPAENRFVKYGMLDQKKLIEQSKSNLSTQFVVPLIKNLTEIKFNANSKLFTIKLPIKNLTEKVFDGQVCLSTGESSILLDQDCATISQLAGYSETSLTFSGKVLDIQADSHIIFNIRIAENIYKLSLVFSRDLNSDSQLTSQNIAGGKFDDMAFISGERKLSRMTRVMDRHKLISFPEYFYLERSRQLESVTSISLLTKNQDGYIVKNINLPKLNQVLSIHRQDINLDGKMDYMIYALSAKKDKLKLFFFDSDLNPLFGSHSEWDWELSNFEGLPIDGGVEKFDWVKIKTNDFGTILVPSINRIFSMPEADNSKNILERVVAPMKHQYYLLPAIDSSSVKIDLRVLDSVNMIKNLRKKLGISDSFRIEVLKTIPQSLLDYRDGVVRLIVKITDDESTKYLELRLNNNFLEDLNIPVESPIDDSLIYQFYNINENQYSSEQIFTNLLNRSSANLVIRDENTVINDPNLVNTWENPIMVLIATFLKDQNRLYFVENRYSVSFIDYPSQSRFDLPVYRDSSFPGQNFSETLIPVVSSGSPGVFVNSTLIYGERIYSMIARNGSFNRPMSLSVDIPDGCVPLNPEYLSSKDSMDYLFLCSDVNRQVQLKSLPMSVN